MSDMSTQGLPSDTPGILVDLNKRTLHFLFDVQRILLGKMVTASDEMLENARRDAPRRRWMCSAAKAKTGFVAMSVWWRQPLSSSLGR